MPVGVGKCLRRIIGKTITGLLKEDIIRAAGSLTTYMCWTGIWHRSSNTCCKEKLRRGKSECLLLVDAHNAFNKRNRKVDLENIKRLCPPMWHAKGTQQLQHSYHAISGKWGPHTVTGRQWRTRRIGGSPDAADWWHILYIKYIFNALNSGHTLFFRASASCSKILNVKSIFNTVKIFRANTVFRTSASCSKTLKDIKYFNEVKNFRENCFSGQAQVLQISEW